MKNSPKQKTLKQDSIQSKSPKGSLDRQSREENEEPRKVILELCPTWRSQLLSLFLFFTTSIAAIWISGTYPDYTVLAGKLFTIGSTVVQLYLPFLVLIPGYFLARALITVYNSRYLIDSHGVEAQVGLVSFNLRQPRLRFEDIRGVEPTQTLLERLLGIGTLLVGSAMTFEVEIAMTGIDNPREVQDLINRSRDQHLRQSNNTLAEVNATTD